jgi:putative MATE family efflux protein
MSHHHSSTSGTLLTEGPIFRSILSFAIPIFWGQLLQQLYNVADTWVIGNFAENDAFAAVSSSGSLVFLIIGFFNGIAIGGGVVISRYFGARDEEGVSSAVHSCMLFGICASVLATLVGLLLVPQILVWMSTPEQVLPYALSYFRIYFGGVATVIMYNICMSIMRALGDSLRPLYYLIFSSVVNVGLDLLFVAVFQWSVVGAAVATVIAQGLSCLLCLIRMQINPDTRLSMKKLFRLHPGMMRSIVMQGLPTGIQNSVISIGNIVVQSNINSFGSYAMAGVGAYSKIEGFVFLPITSMSMALPTFISQNLGAREYDRAKRGAVYGIATGVILAEIIGLIFYFFCEPALGFFVSAPEAIAFGRTQAHIVSFFFCLLAFSHCGAGVMRGCGKSTVPMFTMLLFWCGVRIVYVTVALHFFPVFGTISWAYPLTWSCSSVVFLIFLLKSDWVHAFERESRLRR